MTTTAKFRNVTDDARIVGYGLIGQRTIASGEVLEVPADAADAYRDQDAIWREISTASKGPAKGKAKDKTDDAGDPPATEADEASAGSEGTS